MPRIETFDDRQYSYDNDYIEVTFRNGCKMRVWAKGYVEQWTPPPKEMVEGKWVQVSKK